MIIRFFRGAILFGIAHFFTIGCFVLNGFFPSRAWAIASIICALFLSVFFVEQYQDLGKFKPLAAMLFVLIVVVGGYINAI